jgi:O-antigen/teichoic acid export membrane protein
LINDKQTIKVFKVSKDFLWVSGGQLIGLINNFLLLKIMTSSMSVSAYGYYALWMSIMLFIRQIIYDPISIISAKESINKNFLSIYGLTSLQIVRYVTDRLFFGLLLVAISLVFCEFAVYQKTAIGGYALLGIIYIASNGAQGIYINIFNTIQKRKWAAIGISADSFLKLCLVSIIFFTIEKSLNAAIAAIAISSLIVFFWIRFIAKQFFHPLKEFDRVKFDATKKLVKLSLPFFIPTLFIGIKGFGDKVFMATLIGVEDLAAYNVLLQLGFIPAILLIGVIQTYVSPDIYRLASDYDAKQNKLIQYLTDIIIKIIIVCSFVLCVSFLFSEFIFSVLVGSDYIFYSKFLPFFIIAGSIAAISSLLNIAIIGVFTSKMVAVLMSISIIFGLLILGFAMAVYGFEGGIYGLIASNLIMLFIFICSLKFIPLNNRQE